VGTRHPERAPEPDRWPEIRPPLFESVTVSYLLPQESRNGRHQTSAPVSFPTRNQPALRSGHRGGGEPANPKPPSPPAAPPPESQGRPEASGSC
jgi:hypothetical protein